MVIDALFIFFSEPIFIIDRYLIFIYRVFACQRLNNQLKYILQFEETWLSPLTIYIQCQANTNNFFPSIERVVLIAYPVKFAHKIGQEMDKTSPFRIGKFARHILSVSSASIANFLQFLFIVETYPSISLFLYFSKVALAKEIPLLQMGNGAAAYLSVGELLR